MRRLSFGPGRKAYANGAPEAQASVGGTKLHGSFSSDPAKYKWANAKVIAPGLRLAGGDVHADGDDEDVEEEGDRAVHQADAAQVARSDLHVGNLEGHADGE